MNSATTDQLFSSWFLLCQYRKSKHINAIRFHSVWQINCKVSNTLLLYDSSLLQKYYFVWKSWFSDAPQTHFANDSCLINASDSKWKDHHLDYSISFETWNTDKKNCFYKLMQTFDVQLECISFFSFHVFFWCTPDFLV